MDVDSAVYIMPPIYTYIIFVDVGERWVKDSLLVNLSARSIYHFVVVAVLAAVRVCKWKCVHIGDAQVDERGSRGGGGYFSGEKTTMQKFSFKLITM